MFPVTRAEVEEGSDGLTVGRLKAFGFQGFGGGGDEFGGRWGFFLRA